MILQIMFHLCSHLNRVTQLGLANKLNRFIIICSIGLFCFVIFFYHNFLYALLVFCHYFAVLFKWMVSAILLYSTLIVWVVVEIQPGTKFWGRGKNKCSPIGMYCQALIDKNINIFWWIRKALIFPNAFKSKGILNLYIHMLHSVNGWTNLHENRSLE